VDADDVDLPECQQHKIHKAPELRKSSKSLPMQVAVESREYMLVRQASPVVVLSAMLA